MADTFKNMVIAGMMISLFSFLIIMFVITGGNEYGVEFGADEQLGLNFTQLNSTLQSAQTNAEAWEETFSKGTFFKLATGILVIETLFSITKGMLTVISTPIAIVLNIAINVLHVPAIVAGAFFFVFIVTSLLALWSLFKKGD